MGSCESERRFGGGDAVRAPRAGVHDDLALARLRVGFGGRHGATHVSPRSEAARHRKTRLARLPLRSLTRPGPMPTACLRGLSRTGIRATPSTWRGPCALARRIAGSMTGAITLENPARLAAVAQRHLRRSVGRRDPGVGGLHRERTLLRCASPAAHRGRARRTRRCRRSDGRGTGRRTRPASRPAAEAASSTPPSRC